MTDESDDLDIGLGSALGVEHPAEEGAARLERDGDRLVGVRAREHRHAPEGALPVEEPDQAGVVGVQPDRGELRTIEYRRLARDAAPHDRETECR